ncbi:MAG: hypothetical protein L6V81_03505 [Clostridium sp.]|nr:MAG: hypothetical protein L6V81_03505 [Clostridium sp.]
MNYGGIASSIFTYFFMIKIQIYFYNDGSKKYSDYASTSHAITLIGWDDTYGSVTYKGNTLKGAWLAMNSWGKDNTEYFYISYYDTSVYEYLIGVRDLSLKNI